MMKNTELTSSLTHAFVWWYCDKYLDLLDPYGYYGERIYRLIRTHMKLRGMSFNETIKDFLANLEENDYYYDCIHYIKD